MKFTALIDKSVEKNKSTSSKHGGFKILLDLIRKRLLEEKIHILFVNTYFFVIICFTFSWVSPKVFKKAVSISFTF